MPSVIGKPVDIPTPRGIMDGYAARPSGEPRPLVILFMDVWGLREELFAIARAVAAEGYYCIVPNLFYREGKFRFERRDADGRMVSFNKLPDDLRQDMHERAERLNRGTAREDIASILAFCATEPVRDGPAGSIGFCMGGREAFFAAQDFPERFRATASLHGSRLVIDAKDSPHRMTSSMRGEVYCGFAEFDNGMPAERIARLEQSLQAVAGLRCTTRTHAGAHHGYALPDRDIHDRQATAADWADIFAMFRRQLSR